MYGSHDYEDPEEIREDKGIECFYIEFESTTEKGRYVKPWKFMSLSDAMSEAERVTNQKINWKTNK